MFEPRAPFSMPAQARHVLENSMAHIATRDMHSGADVLIRLSNQTGLERARHAQHSEGV